MAESCITKEKDCAINRGREEERKSRLMLLYHVSQILDTYESYVDSASIIISSETFI